LWFWIFLATVTFLGMAVLIHYGPFWSDLAGA
jgi:hypothetical protein